MLVQSVASTGGGRAEATVAHDVAPAGRFAVRGRATIASEDGLPPTGVAASGRAAEASDCTSAAWCFTTLSRRRCAREGGAGPGGTTAAGREMFLVIVRRVERPKPASRAAEKGLKLSKIDVPGHRASRGCHRLLRRRGASRDGPQGPLQPCAKARPVGARRSHRAPPGLSHDDFASCDVAFLKRDQIR